ncbi:AAA ATPase, putative [Bodo saltans]|uniref:AAA ATPase, putative n=1 Tax=Bodo saltans TaxID=75058 RepID=A0A0S4JSL4_BODSA|nr:AAA ATPase, putative [Bodo saltans]|eukprot:CUG93186.1 AAA ATPase, putative [Bodo saltans]
MRHLRSVVLLPSPPSASDTAPAGYATLPPFSADYEYLLAKETQYVLTSWVRNASNLHLHHGMHHLFRETGLSFTDAAECLIACLDRFIQQLEHRTNITTEQQPRLLRVANALQMTPKEIEALTFLQVCHSGSNFVFSVNNALCPSTVAKFADLNPKELLHFVAEYREHIKQGLVQLDSLGRASLMESKLCLSQEVVAAFTGENLSEEQLIKLEKTCLSTILLAERAAAGGSSPPQKKADETTDGANDGSAKKRPRNSAEKEDDQDDDDSSMGSFISCSDDDGDSGGDDDGGDFEEEIIYPKDLIEKTIRRLKELQAKDPVKAKELAEQVAPTLQSEVAAKMMKEMGLKLPAGPIKRESNNNKDKPKKKSRRTESATPSEASPLLSSVLAPASFPAAVAGGEASGARPSGGNAAATPVTANKSAPIYTSATSAKMNEPYTTDIDYIDDACKLLSNLIKIRNAEGDMKDDVEDNFYNVPKNKVEATIRELKGKFRLQSHVHKARLEATRNAGSWLPRIEQVASKLSLSDMEKQILILLLGNVVSHDVLIAINGRYVMRDGQRELSVGYMLFVLCDGLKERVASRQYFYQNAPLISNALISVNLTSTVRTCFNTDLTDYAVDIDRKIVDYLMGTDMQTAEMVPGSKLYTPTVPLENVVLPSETTSMVLNTIEHYALFDKCKRQCGFGDGLGASGSGLVILFYGPSGTGKTMLANAVAHDLKKKLLLVNLLQFKSDAKSPDVLRFIFREAKLNDAVIFFDECETFFETREANPLVTAILAEFERYDGIIILATNRAQIIDEAMNRRISLMIEFKLPDHQMREKIWRAHLPKHLTKADDVDLEGLALDYELSGGLIRNAMLAAISHAVARDKIENPLLKAEDFVHGAKLQLRGFFLAAEKGSSDSYITPKRNLEELIVEPSIRGQLENIAKITKSRNTLFSQWGFVEHDCVDQGVVYLFHGPSGCGKSLAVEGIAYECGATIRMCNIQEIVMGKDVNIQTIFDEARKLGAIVVFDNAQALFDHSDRSQQLSQLIQYHAVMFPRPVVVVATTGGSTSASASSTAVDPRASKFQFSEEILFTMPSRPLRRELWRRALPSKVPLSSDVDFNLLSEPQVTAKLIRSVCFAACCKVALLPPGERTLTMKLLNQEKEDAIMRERRRSTHSTMFA